MSDQPRYSRLGFWINSHLRSLIFALGELYRSPFQSLTTLLVIGIAMALPIGFYTLLGSSQQISQHWHNEPGITIYLKQNINDQQAQQMLRLLQQNTKIKQVRYISAKQGLKDFTKVAKIDHLIDKLDNNPLPAVLLITPAPSQQTPAAMATLANSLPNSAWIDNTQVDQLWIKRYYYLMTMAERLCLAMAALFGLGVILITGNTIRLSLQSHRDEVELLKMIGATPSYIMRPMLYRGLLYGFIGGLIAMLLIGLVFSWIARPLSRFIATYQQALSLNLLPPGLTLGMLVICALLGLIGAWVASRQYLSNT